MYCWQHMHQIAEVGVRNFSLLFLVPRLQNKFSFSITLLPECQVYKGTFSLYRGRGRSQGSHFDDEQLLLSHATASPMPSAKVSKGGFDLQGKVVHLTISGFLLCRTASSGIGCSCTCLLLCSRDSSTRFT